MSMLTLSSAPPSNPRSSNVDMLVRDIYGGDCDAIGLKGDVIAASFGKVSMQREEERYNGPMFFLRYIGALLRQRQCWR